MKSIQAVKYLVSAMALSLITSTTLSATQTNQPSEVVSSTSTLTLEILQPIAIVESTGKLDIPVLAEPKEAVETISDKNNTANNEKELVSATQLASPLVVSEVMPRVENKKNNYIPLLDGVIIFANFDDSLPAVVNFYTQTSEQGVIDFYQQHFGETISKERKRGRLTLTYQADNLVKRVVISEQNNKRQVDVIVEQVK